MGDVMSLVAPSVVSRRSTRLTGGRKWAARVVWLVVALPLLVVQLFAARPYYDVLRTVCTGPADTCYVEQLTPQSMAALAAEGVSLSGYATGIWVSTMLSLVVWFGVGIVVFLLRSDDWMAILASLFMIVFGGATFAGAALEYAAFAYPSLRPVMIGANVLGELLITAFFLLFPNGRLVPRWLAWLLVVRPAVAATDFLSLTFADPVYYVTFITPIILMVAAQIYRYRRVSTMAERRQTRWVLYGAVVGAGLFLGIVLLAAITGAWSEDITRAGLLFGVLSQLVIAAIPISIGIAVLRSKLWDIDVVIRKTTSYALLTGLLLLVYLGSVVVLQRLLAPLTGESTVAVVLSTLLIAALFLPLRRRVQDAIDRRFFRSKYDAEQVLAQFAATARDETDLDELTAELVRVIQETMQPEFVSVWLSEPDGQRRRRMGEEQA